jgi:hypothetical protein
MPILPVPPAQDFPMLWRPTKDEREAALIEHYESNPGWGYGPARSIAPKFVAGDLSLAAATAGLQKIRHLTARAQNMEVVEALFGMRLPRGVMCFQPPRALLELGRGVRLKIRADLGYSRLAKPHLVLLQVRKFNALPNEFEEAAWASLVQRALRIGDFKAAQMAIWDLRAAEEGAVRGANVVVLDHTMELPEGELNALVNDVLDARQALMDKGYLRPVRPRRPSKDRPAEDPDLFDRRT